MTAVPAKSPDIVLTGRFELGEERRYRHIPFAMPQGIGQLHIRIGYTDQIGSAPLLKGGNTLDVGLFDERGSDPGSPGFRGWSGSERLAITIDESWATPPYRPGPIGAGEWQLLLGPYKIGPRGLDYHVEIWFDPGLPFDLPHSEVQAPGARLTLPRARAGWYRGDLHCHSLYSDGDSWPIELLTRAAEIGLDFLAITDHNGAVRHTSPDGSAGRLPLLIPGIETTTYRGHWNVWGVDGWFDFREPTLEAIRREMARAVAVGGTVSVNHPKPWGPDWDYGAMDGAHAVEVWNGPWERMNVICLAEWEERLLAGARFVAVGGSDTHVIREEPGTGPTRRPRLGEPTTWVQVDGPLTVAGLLAGIRAGRCFVSVSPAGPQLYLERTGADARVRVVNGAGATLSLIGDANSIAAAAVECDDWSFDLPFPERVSYLRAELTGVRGQMLALSNPLWREPAPVR